MSVSEHPQPRDRFERENLGWRNCRLEETAGVDPVSDYVKDFRVFGGKFDYVLSYFDDTTVEREALK